MKTTDRIISKFALPIIAIAGMTLILSIILSAKSTSRQNNAYIRVISCTLSIPATERTQSDIEKCFTSVETQFHIKLERYDLSKI